MAPDLVARYISDEFRSSVKEVLSECALGVQTVNYQPPLFTKDGRRVEALQLNATTRVDAAGVIVGVVGVGQDITAINQTQAELSRVANDLTLVIDNANAPIIGSTWAGWSTSGTARPSRSPASPRRRRWAGLGGSSSRSRSRTRCARCSKRLSAAGTANFEFPL